MKIGILGTGDVGKSLGSALIRRGHDIMLGTRTSAARWRKKRRKPPPVSFHEWLSKNKKIRLGTFAEAAAHGEILLNATAGHASVEVLATVRPGDLKDKILIDVTNALGPWGEGADQALRRQRRILSPSGSSGPIPASAWSSR